MKWLTPVASIAEGRYNYAEVHARNQFREGICGLLLDVSVCEHCIRGTAGKSVGCG